MKIKHYIELLKCILINQAPSPESVDAISLEELYDFCKLNKLIPLGVQLLSYWQPASDEERNLLLYWKSEAADHVFLEYRKFALVQKLVKEANSRGISITFFKGYLLAMLYSDFTLRNSSDTDILVDASQLPETLSLLKELHYTPLSQLDTKNVYTFHYEENGFSLHKIEVHTSLLEDMQDSQIAYLDSIHFSSPENQLVTQCNGLSLQTLTPHHHLLYQILHMAKHIGSHGFPARYLLDTALFINAYMEEIRWQQLHETMHELGYSCFYKQLLSILINYFDIPSTILQDAGVCSEAKMTDLLHDILHFGARAYNDALSRSFYYFERYIEKKEMKSNKLLETVTFDGKTVPLEIVPLEMQENKELQHRICMLRNLKLI